MSFAYPNAYHKSRVSDLGRVGTQELVQLQSVFPFFDSDRAEWVEKWTSGASKVEKSGPRELQKWKKVDLRRVKNALF